MKNITLALLFLSLVACNANRSNQKTDIPRPGTIVAKDEMPVTDDTLNKFTFSIEVSADSLIESGVYDVVANYGPNAATGSFTMPKGGERLTPVIRRSGQPNTYTIGFLLDKDTTFYDYFEVSCSRSQTKMQYIKAYQF